MKKCLIALLCVLFLLPSCQQRQPRAKHVIFLGFDAMSSVGIQRAETSNFNRLIENGAVSLHTRCVRETSSSQNWMSMVSAAPIEMHGVLDNRWKPGDPDNLPPALSNNLGLFPTVFDHIRAQRPDVRQYAFIEWAGEIRMYDMSVFDKSCVMKQDTTLHSYRDVMDRAFSTYLEERPELMFLSIDITDHFGHTYGHESDDYLGKISEVDSLVGDFVGRLEEKGWMNDAVLIISADHGGANFGHGGDSVAEYEIPVILYGKGVTPGKVLKRRSMIYDIGATIAGLLGVELPWECRGKMLDEAFTPGGGEVYVPVPFLHPFKGKAEGDIVITDDIDGAEVYYTLDGSVPDENSIRYDGPFRIDGPAHIKSVAIRNGCRSDVAENYLYTSGNEEPPVRYKLYLNTGDRSMPDFTKYGRPDSEGYISSFALDEFNLGEADFFSVLMTSNLVVAEDAEYTFEVRADDGACLYVDGQLVVSNPNAHSVAKSAKGSVKLSRGLHLLKVEYYEVTSTQGLYIRFSTDGGPFNPLFFADFER